MATDPTRDDDRTRDFAKVIRRKMEADPKLAAAVNEELKVAGQPTRDDVATEAERVANLPPDATVRNGASADDAIEVALAYKRLAARVARARERCRAVIGEQLAGPDLELARGVLADLGDGEKSR
jgi:hypothetical protein